MKKVFIEITGCYDDALKWHIVNTEELEQPTEEDIEDKE